LLQSRWHEERLLALFLLVSRYQRGDATERQAVFDAYVARLDHVDNWDLVDSSAPQIIGAHLAPDDTALLERLAHSARLWDRRVAMLATQYHIKRDEFRPALRIAELLRHDTHDLIHKAVGWMLREIGERDRAVEVRFLDAHWRTMPRTAVRYAIEHLTPVARRRYTH
jgi:3-methyladenine DNA glycosylase AlkD